VVECEAEVVRLVFDAYTRQGLSMAAIARLLNQREVPTRTQHSQWNRSTVWKMLHNSAYQGRAYYGKTELRPRQRITRRVRQRGLPSRNSAFRERPRHDWDRNPRTGFWSVCDLRSGARAIGEEQEVLSPAHHRTILVAGYVGLSALRLWTLPNLDANFQAHNLLLSLPSGGMVIGISRERFATTAPFVRIISMQ
jgi:hypothetical protein